MGACGGGAAGEPATAENAPKVVPSYNRDTGRLERLTSDRNGDGRVDTWAYLDGRSVERIELDRDGDGAVDRIEHYELPVSADPQAPFGGAVIARAEESAGPDRPVTRRESYEGGVLRRVEEDVDGDGRVDKWEEHAGGALVRMDLDLQKRGTPDRRLMYGPRGDVQRVEIDSDGDGVFEAAPATTAPTTGSVGR